MLRRTEAVAATDVPRELTSAVLGDLERYPEWLPGLADARILAHEGDVTLLEARVPVFRAESIILEVIRSSADEIRFCQIGHHGRPEVAGRWRLWGAAERARIGLELRLRTSSFDLGARRRLRRAVETALAALVERVTRIEAGQVPAPGEKRKILEVFEIEGGLELRLRDERYRLLATGDGEGPA